jgi:hypothetical protein
MKIIYSHLKNIQSLIAKHNFTHLEYQLPDDIDVVLTNLFVTRCQSRIQQ